MLKYMKQEANMTTTENGAAAYVSTGSKCLDLFATIGALRGQSEKEIIARFVQAYTEDADLAMKLLFFARDIRGGLGERKVFRTILGWLAKNKPASVQKNLTYVAEYGRFDDLLALMDTPCEKEMLIYLRKQFEADMKKLAEGGSVSLLGKWLPSVNASNQETVYQAKTVFKNAKRRYKEKGYSLPEVVFWNVASRNRQQPVTKNEQGVVLVSGATPRIFSMVAGGNLSPYTFMMEVLQSERYAPIAA